MQNFPMAVGTPKYFEGDILNSKYLSDDKPFGIFDVEVTSPDYLHIPILQTKVKTEFGGIRTVSPLAIAYGRLGMSPEMESHNIISSSDFHHYVERTITSVINFYSGKERIKLLISLLNNRERV